MSSPGPGAFYSPVPQSDPPPQHSSNPWASPAGWVAPTQIYSAPPQAPAGHQAAHRPPGPVYRGSFATPAAKSSRREWVLLTVAVVVLVLGSATAIGLGVGRSTQRISDAQDRVSVRVPQTWSDYTDPDPSASAVAGQDRIPDLETVSFLAGQYLDVYLDEPDPDGLLKAHEGSVAETCYQWRCRTKGSPMPVIIDGQRGLEQVVTHFSEADGSASSVVLTVQSADLLVCAVAVRESIADDPPSADPLTRLLHTLAFTR